MKMNYQTICRICLGKNSGMISIFQYYKFLEHQYEIFRVITDCASVQIEKFDGFSEQICKRCLDLLSQAYSFKKLCEDSNYKFKNDLIVCNDTEMKSDLPEAASIPQNGKLPNVVEETADDGSKISYIGLTQVKNEIFYDEIKIENLSDENEDVMEEVSEEDLEASRLSGGVFTTREYEGPSGSKDSHYTEIDTSGNYSFASDLIANNETIKSEISEEGINNYVEINDIQEITEERSKVAELTKVPKEDIEVDASSFHLLPKKSKGRYLNEREKFLQWMKLKNAPVITEEVVVGYFKVMKDKYAPPSLWSTYSMLRSTLFLFEKVDISKFKTLFAILKSNTEGYRRKEAKAFDRTDLEKFMSKAPDEIFLLMKMAVVIGVMGACKCEELVNMETTDIKDNGTELVVNIKKMKNCKPRSFVVTAEFSGLEIFRKYAALRPSVLGAGRFFLCYRSGKCTMQPIGINNLSKIPRLVAKYLKMKDAHLYTGHCYRRTSVTLRL